MDAGSQGPLGAHNAPHVLGIAVGVIALVGMAIVFVRRVRGASASA